MPGRSPGFEHRIVGISGQGHKGGGTAHDAIPTVGEHRPETGIPVLRCRLVGRHNARAARTRCKRCSNLGRFQNPPARSAACHPNGTALPASSPNRVQVDESRVHPRPETSWRMAGSVGINASADG